jgi:hypothetical protein
MDKDYLLPNEPVLDKDVAEPEDFSALHYWALSNEEWLSRMAEVIRRRKLDKC